MSWLHDNVGIYTIHVAGELNLSNADYLGGLSINHVRHADDQRPVTTVLTGTLTDQAALLGVLNWLYNNHFPLISVRYNGRA